MLGFLNVFFFAFHTVWTLFNCVGWVWKRTRRIHLVTMLLTGLSWFVLGIWYGWGYCLCTDWHYRVLEKLGREEARSYSRLLIEEVLHVSISADAANAVTGGIFLVAAVLTVVLNLRDYLKRRR
jgi:hypothetical protein